MSTTTLPTGAPSCVRPGRRPRSRVGSCSRPRAGHFGRRVPHSPIRRLANFAGVLGRLGAPTGTGRERYLGSRSSHAGPFLAVALILPYLVVGVGTFGTYQRVKDEVGTWFNDLSGAARDPGGSGSAENVDGTTTDSSGNVHNDSGALVTENYTGVNCNSLFSKLGSFDECMANGGFADVGSGTVEGDPSFVDKNADSVDDHFYDGLDCRATPLGDLVGSQQEFPECDANGGKKPWRSTSGFRPASNCRLPGPQRIRDYRTQRLQMSHDGDYRRAVKCRSGDDLIRHSLNALTAGCQRD